MLGKGFLGATSPSRQAERARSSTHPASTQRWAGGHSAPGPPQPCGCLKELSWLAAFWVKIPSFGELPDVIGSFCWRWAPGRAHLHPYTALDGRPGSVATAAVPPTPSPCLALMAGGEGEWPHSFPLQPARWDCPAEPEQSSAPSAWQIPGGGTKKKKKNNRVRENHRVR